jgi:GNAT superfamily N-acetyltransferase
MELYPMEPMTRSSSSIASQRQGIGTALLQTAETYLRQQGRTAILIHLGGKEYFESRRFYPKHGYSEYKSDWMKKEL